MKRSNFSPEIILPIKPRMHICPCSLSFGIFKKVWIQTYFELVTVDSVQGFYHFSFWRHRSRLASFFLVLVNCIFWGASFQDLTCKRGSVGQSEGLSIPRSSVRFRLKPDTSNSHEFELHRPSNKGTKLLLKVIKAIIIIARLSCTADTRPLNEFEKGPNLAENGVEYVSLTTWDVNSIFFSANRARPGSQELLPLNGILIRIRKKHIRIGNKFDCVEGVSREGRWEQNKDWSRSKWCMGLSSYMN